MCEFLVFLALSFSVSSIASRSVGTTELLQPEDTEWMYGEEAEEKKMNICRSLVRG